MKQVRQYEFEGITLTIPLRYDAQVDMYLEDYREFIETPCFTPEGHPILFAGEDACRYAEEFEPGGCADCSACRHYLRAAPHTWIGICRHHKNQRPTHTH